MPSNTPLHISLSITALSSSLIGYGFMKNGFVSLTLPLLLTYIYVTHLMTFTAKGAPHLQFVHSSVLRVYIYV